MRAYVDESVPVAAHGLYVLAGVVVRPEQAEPVRDVLRSELRHQRRPFHWRLEERTDRESMAKRIGALNLFAVVAVASPVDAHRLNGHGGSAWPGCCGSSSNARCLTCSLRAGRT